MRKIETYSSRGRLWSMALLLSAVTVVAVGCGGGDNGRDPILGIGADVVLAPPAGAIAPGAVCPVAGPSVNLTNPTNGNQFATTSTSGVANGGRAVTATFSEAMNAATINAATFKLAPTGGVALIPASVSYNATSKVATLTTSSALLANTNYTAVIQGPITNGTGTPIGCSYTWTFKTAVVAAAAPVPVDLGLASSFGISATAGVTNTPTLPITHINGDVVLDPNATCNAVTIDTAGGFGLCGGNAPTLTGKVISPLFNVGVTSTAIQNDLRAAFLSITPPAGPPAAGSLGGATAIAAGTTLGEPNGAALVQGDNLFAPGIYQSTTSILITGELTLDAQGDENAAFIFQSSSTIGTAPNAKILLVNGAKASNVFWQAGTSATLGTASVWEGNILASESITMNTGATSCGRLLAGAFTAGAFVFDANVVSVPGNPSAPATCK